MQIRFFVPGHIQPKQRPRVCRGRAFTPRETLEYETRVRREAIFATQNLRLPPCAAVTLALEAVYEVPPSWRKSRREAARGAPKISRPDLDNLLKSAMDALNEAIVPDDAQIARIEAVKRHAREGEEAGLYVALSWEEGDMSYNPP